MMAAFTWFITFVSLAGTVLNVRKNILCFYLWAVGNIAWLGFDVASGLYKSCCAGCRPPGVRHLGDIRMERKGHPLIRVMGVEERF